MCDINLIPTIIFSHQDLQIDSHAFHQVFGVALKRAVDATAALTSETVQGASLTLQGIDDVHGGDGLSLGVLSVGDGIANDVLEEHLQDATGLLVDQARDTLDASSTCQTTDGRLGYALDVIAKYLAMTLGAPFAESLTSLATSRHAVVC